MTLRRTGWHLPLLLVAVVGLVLTWSPAQGYVIIFKDGFVLQGKVKQEKTFIVDKVSGKPFSVPVGGKK